MEMHEQALMVWRYCLGHFRRLKTHKKRGSGRGGPRYRCPVSSSVCLPNDKCCRPGHASGDSLMRVGAVIWWEREKRACFGIISRRIGMFQHIRVWWRLIIRDSHSMELSITRNPNYACDSSAHMACAGNSSVPCETAQAAASRKLHRNHWIFI